MFNHWQITIRHLLRGSPFLFFSFFSSISFVIERRSMKSLCIHSTSSSHASSSFLLFYFYFLSESSLLFPYRFPSSIFFFPFLSIVDDGVVTTSTKADKKARGNVFDISHGRIYREGCCRMRGNLRQEMFSDKKYFEVRNVC